MAALLLVLWMRRPARDGGAEPAIIGVLRTAAGEVWGLVVDNGSLAVLTVALVLGVGLFVAETAQRGTAAVFLTAGVVAAVTLTLHGERRRALGSAAASPPAAATQSLDEDRSLSEKSIRRR